LPPLSTPAAHIISGFFAVSYVGSLYISKNARLSFRSNQLLAEGGHMRQRNGDERWRDHPDVIKARLLAVCLSTLLSCMSVFWLLWHVVGDHQGSVLVALETAIARLGLTLFDDHSLCPYFVTPILYLGPLYATYLYAKLPFQTGWSFKGDLYPVLFTWPGVRNYIFGPLTEEVVFRACVLAVYHLAGSSTNKMIFLSPLLFGLDTVELVTRFGGLCSLLSFSWLIQHCLVFIARFCFCEPVPFTRHWCRTYSVISWACPIL